MKKLIISIICMAVLLSCAVFTLREIIKRENTVLEKSIEEIVKPLVDENESYKKQEKDLSDLFLEESNLTMNDGTAFFQGDYYSVYWDPDEWTYTMSESSFSLTRIYINETATTTTSNRIIATFVEFPGIATDLHDVYSFITKDVYDIPAYDVYVAHLENDAEHMGLIGGYFHRDEELNTLRDTAMSSLYIFSGMKGTVSVNIQIIGTFDELKKLHDDAYECRDMEKYSKQYSDNLIEQISINVN